MIATILHQQRRDDKEKRPDGPGRSDEPIPAEKRHLERKREPMTLPEIDKAIKDNWQQAVQEQNIREIQSRLDEAINDSWRQVESQVEDPPRESSDSSIDKEVDSLKEGAASDDYGYDAEESGSDDSSTEEATTIGGHESFTEESGPGNGKKTAPGKVGEKAKYTVEMLSGDRIGVTRCSPSGESVTLYNDGKDVDKVHKFEKALQIHAANDIRIRTARRRQGRHLKVLEAAVARHKANLVKAEEAFKQKQEDSHKDIKEALLQMMRETELVDMTVVLEVPGPDMAESDSSDSSDFETEEERTYSDPGGRRPIIHVPYWDTCGWPKQHAARPKQPKQTPAAESSSGTAPEASRGTATVNVIPDSTHQLTLIITFIFPGCVVKQDDKRTEGVARGLLD